MLLSRALKTEIYSSATICEKHLKVLGKEFYKSVAYRCNWHNHERIAKQSKFGSKRRKTSRNLVAITRQESFFLHTHHSMFYPFGCKFCYDCRINEIDELLEDINPDEFSTPLLFQSTLALWKEEEPKDKDESLDEPPPIEMDVSEQGDENPGTSLVNVPGTSGMIPSAPPQTPPNITNVGQISSQFSGLSVTPPSISTQSSTSSGLPSQLEPKDIAELTRKAVKDLLQLGGYKIPNPPPAIILNDGRSQRRIRTFKGVIGRTIASLMKLTVTQKNEVRRLWNVLRESDAVTRHLPGSVDPGIALTEYILAWNGSNSSNRRLELLSLMLTMIPASQLKKFNADGSSGLKFNPPITDRQICKAKIHR